MGGSVTYVSLLLAGRSSRATTTVSSRHLRCPPTPPSANDGVVVPGEGRTRRTHPADATASA